MALPALLALLIAAPALADRPAPAPDAQQFVDPGILMARAESLRDAVADSKTSDFSIKQQAYGFFDKLPQERLAVAAGGYRRMERENVSGKLGSLEGMQKTADERIAEWRRTHTEPPPPEVEATVAQARAFQGSKRLAYDEEAQLAPNQMGIFTYMRNTADAGLIKLNQRMKILGALVGDAFTYATVTHEAQHALDRASGRLTPEQEIAGEISAFRVQYLWLKLIDPSGEKMLTLHASLRMAFKREADPEVKKALGQAITYLEHLSDVVSTNGKEEELKKLIEKLGYSDDHHDGDGHDHGRGAAAPTSA